MKPVIYIYEDEKGRVFEETSIIGESTEKELEMKYTEIRQVKEKEGFVHFRPRHYDTDEIYNAMMKPDDITVIDIYSDEDFEINTRSGNHCIPISFNEMPESFKKYIEEL